MVFPAMRGFAAGLEEIRALAEKGDPKARYRLGEYLEHSQEGAGREGGSERRW